MRSAPVVLLTGFEPFGGEDSNPSWATVQRVRDAWTGDASVHVRELPVEFGRVGEALAAAMQDTSPDIVICVGQAGGTRDIHLERVAINVDDARIPDNAGFQPIDSPIIDGAPDGYFSTLPIKAAVAAIEALGIPAAVSHSAGTFTCNHVFYRLMHTLRDGHRGVRGGFVHVPYSAEQAAGTDRPSLPIESMVLAVTAVIEATLANVTDAKLVGGALH